MREPRTSSELIVSYLTLRRVIGCIGVGLPIVLAVWGFAVQHTLQPTISDYYGTQARDVFVGSLIAIGLFLYTYHGNAEIDNRVSNVAGALAIGVALLPTGGTRLEHALHLACAAGLFLLLAYICSFLFTKKDDNPTLQKLTRNRVYQRCGAAIVACIALIVVYNNSPLPDTWLAWYRPVFVLETFALWAFGFSWFVKGETFWRDPV